MAISLSNFQKVMVTATALDAGGNAVGFVEAPVFSVGNTSLAKLVALGSGDTGPALPSLGMWLVPNSGQVGSDTVTVSENAVAGDTSTSISGTLDYEVTQGEAPDVATTISVSGGSPVDQGAQVQPVAAKAVAQAKSS